MNVPSPLRTVLSTLLMLLPMFSLSNAAPPARVTLVRTPHGGIQPQAAVDSQGTVHLIYYSGDPKAGDVFYCRRSPIETDFSEPIQVNHQADSAIAAGTIRGAQLAIGQNDRVHVVWNGHPPPQGNYLQAPLFYTRLDGAGSAFERERNIITYAGGLDGGSSVAADRSGNVYVTWHAPRPGNTNGEAGRAVFLARSTDNGKTFQREIAVSPESAGACGCCGMRALADNRGSIYILFRGASEKVNRDEILLISTNAAAAFAVAYSHPWNVSTCPMSSATLAESPSGIEASWETAGQVWFATVNPRTGKVSSPIAPPGEQKRKHPVVVANEKGEKLFVWTEGTGWAKGGAVAWQLYDRDGKPTADKGRAAGVPVWSLATAFAKADGNFVVVY